MKSFIQFNIPKYIIDLIIIFTLNTFHIILSNYSDFGNNKKNTITLPLLMFIGQSLVYFFYILQKKFYNDNTFLNDKNGNFF